MLDREKLSVQALLFDLDGTLLDSFEQYSRSLAAAMTDFGLQVPSRSCMRQSMGGPGRETLRILGVPPEQVEPVHSRWVEWAWHVADSTHPFPGIVPLLERLGAAGYQLGIVTSRPRRSVDGTPAALELLPRVDVLVTRDDTAEGKPHPAPVLHALHCLGVSPEQCVYVGDACYDMQAGQRAGCWTVLATWDGATIERGNECQPHFVVTSPDELVALLLDREHGS